MSGDEFFKTIICFEIGLIITLFIGISAICWVGSNDPLCWLKNTCQIGGEE